MKYHFIPANSKCEIRRLCYKYHLVIQVVHVTNYPRIIGLARDCDVQVCSLWNISYRKSRRKVKKEMKKFLRGYKENQNE